MVIKTQSTGRSVTRLNVGTKNVRRYFPRNVLTIELQLDYLQIQWGLGPAFWQIQPDIDDPGLRAWRELNYHYGKPGRIPVPLAMIAAGKGSSPLQPISLRVRAKLHKLQELQLEH
jgi:hypothetical protein